MKFKSIAFGVPSLAFACTVGAVPVPSYDSTALLSEASAALVGKIVSSEVLPDGRVLLGLRVEKPFKGRLAAQQSLALTLPVDGVQLASPSVGTRGLFVLRCAGTQCSPLDAYRAYWPAVEAGSPSTAPQSADAVASAVLAELAAVVGAGDTALAASTGEGVLSVDQAQQLRSVAAAAMASLSRPEAVEALHALGRPSDFKIRLAISAAELKLGDTSALADISEAMLSGDPAFAPGREDVASQGMGLTNLEGKLAPVFASWLKAADPQVRITAAYCLRTLHTRAVISPLLANGIVDKEQWVRYYSVGGLAAATGEGHVPSIDLFMQRESVYIGYWKSRQTALTALLAGSDTRWDGPK